jgi:HEAT repeat protein
MTASTPLDKDMLRNREIENQMALLAHPVASVRSGAARRLGEMKAGIDGLIELLSDSHEGVRAAAALALGSFAGDARISQIADYLLAAIDDPSEKVCQAAIRSLGMLRAQMAREEIETFLDDPSDYVLGAAVLALARLEANDLAPRLAELLNHPSLFVKCQAVRAVGLLKYAQAGPAIFEMLGQARAVRARTYQETPASQKHKEGSLNSLLGYLIRTAGDLQLEAAAPLLIDIAQNDVGMRGQAVEALMHIGANVAPELLTGLLNDPSVNLRRRLVQMMAQFEYRPSLPLLRPLLSTESAAVRGAALSAITRMGDREAIPMVERMCFHDPNPFVRAQAVQSLVSLAGAQANITLMSLVSDSNARVRQAAVTNLMSTLATSDEALPVLATFVEANPSSDLASEIARALKQKNYQPDQSLPESPTASLLPDNLVNEAPQILTALECWQQHIRSSGLINQSPTWKNTDAALGDIILILRSVLDGEPQDGPFQ